MKRLIHFVHGNGFPSLCYKQFLQALEPEYDYCYIDRVGHTLDYPVTDNWEYLVDEVLFSVERQTSEPVIAVGHSLGGVLSLMAATRQPELFKMIVLLDSPLLTNYKTTLIKIAKILGLIDYFTPALRTKTRREHWKTKQEVMEYLKSRPLFASFDERCLQDYITYGLDKSDRGFQLRFDREVEYNIYRTIPHKLAKYRGKLQTPTALIYGDKSTVVTSAERHFMNKEFGIQGYPISGTHLFPFEKPELAAEKVKEVLDLLQNQCILSRSKA